MYTESAKSHGLSSQPVYIYIIFVRAHFYVRRSYEVIFLRILHRYFRIAFLSDDMVLNNFTLYILSSKE